MIVPFYRSPKMTAEELEEVQKRVTDALKSGQITNGKNVREFEERVREIHDVKHVVACSSATQALWIVLRSLRIKEVMIQSFTWQSIKHILPERVVYCDVDKETWLMNPNIRSQIYHPKTQIATHTFGNTTLPNNNKKTIYDAAYSLSAKLPDIGEATIISTTATKTVTSCEGGLILTDNDQLAKKATEMRRLCSRMSEVNAIVGLVYLKRLDWILDRKKKIFAYYNTHLPFKPQKISALGSSYGYYGCHIPNRDVILNKLKDKVETRIRYEPLMKGFDVTDELARSILILPCYPDLEPEKVVEAFEL